MSYSVSFSHPLSGQDESESPTESPGSFSADGLDPDGLDPDRLDPEGLDSDGFNPDTVEHQSLVPSPALSSAAQLARMTTRWRSQIWFFGIPYWLFGLTDRGLAAFADGYISTLEAFQLFIASFFFVGWLYLRPQQSKGDRTGEELGHYPPHQWNSFLQKARSRMRELQEYHLITQEYVLPFSHLCQIYHLLNLKHLENVHSFSLNNLRIVGVSEFQQTAWGGILRFQTALDSPINALRIWRKPIVEVELVLQTPHTVELRIPVYQDKRIIVLFNVLPISTDEHKLFIDIYSNLNWPKPLLQLILHLASCLTLFEDLPYLKRLAERNIHHLFDRDRARQKRISHHDTMLLFNRFVDLYGIGEDNAQSPSLHLLSEAG